MAGKYLKDNNLVPIHKHKDPHYISTEQLDSHRSYTVKDLVHMAALLRLEGQHLITCNNRSTEGNNIIVNHCLIYYPKIH